jgi:hypothetical protein
MDFNIKASNIILVNLQMKIIFQQNIFFQHTYVLLEFVQIFFMKSHVSNFSIVIEMVQSIHIQYMIRYFIKLNAII